jgi:hypothetical protein
MANRLSGATRTCVRYKKSKTGRPVCAKFRKTGKSSGVPSRRARKGIKSRFSRGRVGQKATVSVSRAKATKRNGRLVKGCRFVGSGKVKCRADVAKRLKSKKATRSTAKKRTRTTAKKRKSSKRSTAKATVSVSRAKATKSNGKLRKGCRFVGGKKVKCTPKVAASLGKKRKPAKRKKAARTTAKKRRGKKRRVFGPVEQPNVAVPGCQAKKQNGRLLKGCRWAKKGERMGSNTPGQVALCTSAVAKKVHSRKCVQSKAAKKALKRRAA